MWPLILGFWLLAALLLFANRPQRRAAHDETATCPLCGKPSTSSPGVSLVCEDCRPRGPRRSLGHESDDGAEGKVLPFEPHKRRKP